MSAGMVFLRANPYTIAFSIAYGVADVAGYNPIDMIYNQSWERNRE